MFRLNALAALWARFRLFKLELGSFRLPRDVRTTDKVFMCLELNSPTVVNFYVTKRCFTLHTYPSVISLRSLNRSRKWTVQLNRLTRGGSESIGYDEQILPFAPTSLSRLARVSKVASLLTLIADSCSPKTAEKRQENIRQVSRSSV